MSESPTPNPRKASHRTAPWYTTATLPVRLGLAPLTGVLYRTATGVRPLASLPVGSWKRSETAFILGSGPSVNQLTQPQWGEIRAGTAIGFNWWLKHPFVPDLYVFENIRDEHRRLLTERARDYEHTPLILKQFLTNFSPRKHRSRIRLLNSLPEAIRRHLYLSSDLLIPGRTPEELAGWVRTFARRGVFDAADRFQWLPKRTSSLTFLVALCARAGFERIVLCGVDLNRPGYFFDTDQTRGEGHLKDPLGQGRGATGGLHATEDPSAKVLPISVVLRVIDTEVLAPRRVTLAVANGESALASILPVHTWDEMGARST